MMIKLFSRALLFSSMAIFFNNALAGEVNTYNLNKSSVSQQEAISVSFMETTKTASEADLVPLKLTIRRSGTAGKLAVNYTVSGNAISDKDYIALAGTVTFQNGASAATVTIQPLADYRINDYRKMRKDRIVSLALVPGNGYTIGDKPVATVTIINSLTPKKLPSDELFFTRLNLDLPALSPVKAAVKSKNYAAARKSLAKYYRTRKNAPLPFGKGHASEQVLENALKNTYSVSGITYTYKPTNTVNAIDWSYSVEENPNWSWEFNRFAWWKDLTQAYADNPAANKKYAQRLFAELDNWLKTSRLDITQQQLQGGNRWRQLEVGIRVEGAWLFAFHNLKNSPELSDELLVDWVKSFYMHQRFLEESSELFTNRGTTEATALFMGSVYFPEFKETLGWRQLSITRIENIIKNDILPDGASKELSPGYHDITLGAIQRFQEMANGSNIKTSTVITSAIEKMFDYLMYASEPNRYIPFLNDSHRFNPMDGRLRSAFKLFPERKDFQWFSTGGKEGSPIKATSWLFPNAGQAVMRSGWSRNDNYLLMDAGPYGTSHGNEDKLSISVDGYGVKHIIDCGPYNYEYQHPLRKYSVSTHGKSAPLVDNLSQNRLSVKTLYDRKSPVAWYTSATIDYAAATYGADSLEVLGTEKLRPAITTRHILYLKPDVWILVDAFQPLDKQEHLYSSLFQCNDDNVEVDKAKQTVKIQLLPGEFDPFYRVSTTTVQPSLTITPLIAEGETLQVFKGQESPFISGWHLHKSTPWKKQPIPTLRYEVKTSGNAQLAYILAASPADKTPRNFQLSNIKTDEGTYGLKLTETNAADRILLIATNNKTLSWKGKTYDATAMIIEGNGEPKLLSKGSILQN